MDIHDVVERMISASGLPRANVRIDASLFRSVGARTNLGLINAENLSVQIHLNHVTPNTPAEDEPRLESRPIPKLQAETEHSAADRETPAGPGPDGPRIVDRHLFDVRNTFRFHPDFVFEERKITVNTIPIYFVRTGGLIRCEITSNNVMLCEEAFSVRDGELRLSEGEGVFNRCEQPALDVAGLKSYDTRLARLVSHEPRRFYRHGVFFICVFPIASRRRTLPLGRDDGIFPANAFGPAALVCVAKLGADASYRIRSHFYVVADDGDRP